MNAMDHDPEFDQIVLSARHWSEVRILDPSTTREEARGSTGGRSEHGGDLLYRWGNPERYRRGAPFDRQFFCQNDVRCNEPGLPGGGRLMVFNSGKDARNHSSVDEIELPVDADGHYVLDEEGPSGPVEPVWTCEDRAGGFFSGFISGAHRWFNGNTLTCSEAQFRIVDVTAAGEVVRNYQLDPPSAGGFEFPGFGFSGGAPFVAASVPGDFDIPLLPSIFRAYRIPLDHPALEGRTLTPIEEA